MFLRFFGGGGLDGGLNPFNKFYCYCLNLSGTKSLKRKKKYIYKYASLSLVKQQYPLLDFKFLTSISSRILPSSACCERRAAVCRANVMLPKKKEREKHALNRSAHVVCIQFVFHLRPERLLRHDIVLLVETASQSAGNLLRGEGQSERADGTNSPVDLVYGGVLTDGCQEDVSCFIRHWNLMGGNG